MLALLATAACLAPACLLLVHCAPQPSARSTGGSCADTSALGEAREKCDEANERLRDGVLRSLASDVWVRLAPSRVHGVGVVAIRDIPRGMNPFRMANAGPCGGESDEGVIITKQHVRDYKVPATVMSYVEAFFHRFTCHPYIPGCPTAPISADTNPSTKQRYEAPEAYGMLKRGLNSIDVSFFLNHAKPPRANVAPSRVRGCRWYQFTTLRAVAAGEELTFDYSVWDGGDMDVSLGDTHAYGDSDTHTHMVALAGLGKSWGDRWRGKR
jgi:hypothetical protein